MQNPTFITCKIYQLLQITLRRTFTQNVELKKKKPGDIENPHIMS